MIVGMGIDAVEIARMKKWAGDPALLNRYFCDEEIADCRERGGGMAQSLAARFAAKEAFGKALGTGLSGFSLKDVAVKATSEGAPSFAFSGGALSRLKEKGAGRAHLSLTHEAGIAFASVILEG
jgi:holo-[acyl-carrier protein] synthase